MTQRSRGVLHVYVAAAKAPDAVSVAFVDARARVLEHVALAAAQTAPPCARALRGVVYALWQSRRLGYRRVAIHCDVPAAASLLAGERRLEPALIGPYLEARALMRTYRWTRIDVGELRWWHGPADAVGSTTEQLSVLPRERAPDARTSWPRQRRDTAPVAGAARR
jgi:hypothetical protein